VDNSEPQFRDESTYWWKR